MTTAFHGTAETDRLASEAGRWLQRIVAEECAKAFEVTGKASDLAGDVVTQTDYDIQNRLQEVLQRLLPEGHFVGEEDYATRDR
jgi:fructose-1,6-bisphosphatase/inositol monophosphatase family enzyme